MVAQDMWWWLRRICGGGCAGYVVGLWHDNHTTSWPILQAEICKNSVWAEFQDGPSVAIINNN